MTIHVSKAVDGTVMQEIDIGKHRLFADVDLESGGNDFAVSPHDLFDAALGACTALTLMLYAKRKKIALDHVDVNVTRDNTDEKSGVYRLARTLTFHGVLSDEEKNTLLQIANKCPIHKLMQHPVSITTEIQ